MAGLPGTGKSTLAGELAQRTSGRVLSKDEFRHAIFMPEEVEYSTRQDDFCQELMLLTMGYLLSGNPQRTIILDGRPFSRRYQIENAIAAADSLHQAWRILECVCSQDTVKNRLEANRLIGTHPAGNRGWQLYQDVNARFETIHHPKTVVDTDHCLAECVEQALKALRPNVS